MRALSWLAICCDFQLATVAEIFEEVQLGSDLESCMARGIAYLDFGFVELMNKSTQITRTLRLEFA